MVILVSCMTPACSSLPRISRAQDSLLTPASSGHHHHHSTIIIILILPDLCCLVVFNRRPSAPLLLSFVLNKPPPQPIIYYRLFTKVQPSHAPSRLTQTALITPFNRRARIIPPRSPATFSQPTLHHASQPRPYQCSKTDSLPLANCGNLHRPNSSSTSISNTICTSCVIL